MSKFEITILVLAAIVPIVSLLAVLPKIKKKEKKKVEEKTTEKAEKEVVKPEQAEPKAEKVATLSNEISSKELQSYAEFKKKNISKPKRVEIPNNLKDMTMPYLPPQKIRKTKKPQTVAEEIQSLSPELKALIIAGVLDKKDFD